LLIVKFLLGPIFPTLAGVLFPAAKDRTIHQWDVVTSEAVRVLRFPTGESKPAVSFSLDVRFLAVAFEEGTKKHWISSISLADLHVIRLFKGHADTVTDLAFSPDGSRIASSDWKDSVRV
jgi:WD40 repeat protein